MNDPAGTSGQGPGQAIASARSLRRQILASARANVEKLALAPESEAAIAEALGLGTAVFEASGWTAADVQRRARRYVENRRAFDECPGCETWLAALGRTSKNRVLSRAPWLSSDALDPESVVGTAVVDALWAFESAKASSTGTSFLSGFRPYAARAVQNAMVAIAWEDCPKTDREGFRWLHYKEHEFIGKWRRAPSDDELAQCLGVSVTKLLDLRRAFALFREWVEPQPTHVLEGSEAFSFEEQRWESEDDTRRRAPVAAEIYGVKGTIPPVIKAALKGLSRFELEVLRSEETDHPLRSNQRQAKRRANEALRRGILTQWHQRLSAGDRQTLMCRYRRGIFRSEPSDGERGIYREFLRWLCDEGIYEIVLSKDARHILARRYVGSESIETICKSRGWSRSGVLGCEFASMIGLVPNDDGLSKRSEPAQALLPTELDAIEEFARARTRIQTQSDALNGFRDGLEILAWLHEDERRPTCPQRYLNFGNKPTTTKEDRARLSNIAAGMTLGDEREWLALRASLTNILGFGDDPVLAPDTPPVRLSR